MRKNFASNFLKRVGALLLVSVMLLSSIPLTVNAVGSTDADITAIAAPATKALIVNYDQWVVNVSASLRLPETVTVTLADGSEAEANVTWDTTTLNYGAVGTYRLAGEVELPEGATNSRGLTVVQKVVVREYLNLLKNPSFESGTSDWKFKDGPVHTQVSSPVQDGDYAIQSVITSRSQRPNYISQSITNALNESGAGEYYISTWGQLGEDAEITDGDTYWTRMNIQADGKEWEYVGTSYISSSDLSPAADTADGNKAPVSAQAIIPVKGEWRQSHRRVMLNFERIDQARIVVGITGGSAFASKVYIDHTELVPLNVTLPASSHLGEEEEIVEVSALPIKALIENYDQWVVNVNSSLRLPQTVTVITDKGNAVNVDVEWNTENLKYDTVGEYELTGILKASEAGLANTEHLTATQKVLIRSYQNLLKNPSFESGTSDWKFKDGPVHTQVSSPVQDGDYAIQSVITSRSQRPNYISQSITNALNESGAGEYYISTWGQLGEDAEITDGDTYWTRMNIQADGKEWEYVGTSYISSSDLSPAADTADGNKAPVSAQAIIPVKGEWRQSHRRVMLNFERIDQARIVVGITGGSAFASKVYIDHTELVPLNVTLPADNDIASCASLPDIRVYEGTAFGALDLPNTVEVTLRDGRIQSIPVIWSEGSYLATPGTYTISGRFNLSGLAVMNSKHIAPQITVVVRESGANLRDTYYFSTSGDDSNDGLTEATPKKSVELIPALLKSGANVLLKRGDIWYVPEFSLNVDGVKGTSEEDRITLGAYGNESDPKPILGFMYQKTASEWRNEGNNVYSADVSKLTAVKEDGVYRLFVDGTVYSLSTLVWGYRNYETDGEKLTAIDNPANLEEEEFCVSGNRVYMKTKGQSFSNVELVPWGTTYGHRLTGTDVSYLTIENLDLRGGSTCWAFAWFGAPSCGLLIENTDFLYVGLYIIQFSMTGITARTHVNPTIRGCTLDGMHTEKEGADFRVSHEAQSIEMREAIDGALIENNVFRNVGHCAVELSMPGSSKKPEMSSVVSGVKNCIIQNNLVEGANSGYARAFSIIGHTNVGADHDMVHDNIIRWNECYGMTTSVHLLGENNAVYGNIFAFSYLRYTGWKGQPYAIDTVMWDSLNGKKVSKDNVVMNNTIYGDVAGIAIAGKGENLTGNLYANNLFANHLNTDGTYTGGIGVSWWSAEGTLYFLNNGFHTNWSENNAALAWNGKAYTAEEANRYIPNAKGNIDAEPGFKDVDESIRVKYEKCFDFSLCDDSVYRYAGFDINELDVALLQQFPILQKLDSSDADGIQLKDLYGNAFLSKTPSVGAISYTKTLNGTVASVEEVAPKTVKTGTPFAELELPRTVAVTLQDGTKALLAVGWNENSYQATTVGTQTVTGTLSGDVHPNLNLNGKSVFCQITVKDQLEITELLEINGVTVPNGTAAENVGLPNTCSVILEDGSTVTLEVCWSAPADFDASKAGTYTFVGAPILTSDTANTENLQYSVSVTVQKLLGKGDELLINPDFIENGTYDPWVMGWNSTQGTIEVTTDPALVKEGEPAAMIVTANTRYASLQQDVTTQVKNLGNGKYLFGLWIRALKEDEPIITSKIDLQAKAVYLGAAVENIGTEYVQVREIFDVTTTEEAGKIVFHTSTYKDKDDVGKSFIISGCSLIYLGADDAEAAVTLDKLGLTWDAIRGENESQDNVTTALILPTDGENGSKITWNSSDESVISADGRVTPGKETKTVTLTATIEGEGYTDYVEFTLVVPGTAPEVTYTVTFKTNGGTAVEKQIVKPGEKINEPVQLTRSGYTFDGWYKDVKLTEKWDFEKDTVSADLTLYAKWNRNTTPATGDIGSPTLFIAGSTLSLTILCMLVFALLRKRQAASSD